MDSPAERRGCLAEGRRFASATLRAVGQWGDPYAVNASCHGPPALSRLSPRFRGEGGRRAKRAFACALGIAGAAVAIACGPSFQALYEGDARFEHCYALEETGAVSMTQKSDCWRGWILRYTYGQTRDRVEYAASRYRALTRAPQAPTDEAMMEAAPGEGRSTSIAAPAPTSAFAPPPKVLGESDGGTEGTSGDLPATGYSEPKRTVVTEESQPAPPGAGCAAACDAQWSLCRWCDGGAKCAACTATYKKCMRGCFTK
jgi:hypothetical protein